MRPLFALLMMVALPAFGQISYFSQTLLRQGTPELWRFYLGILGTNTSTGITNLNGLSGQSQTFATGMAGLDFNILSAGTIHSWNLPTADATHRGALAPADWTIFNSKSTQADIDFASNVLRSAISILQGMTNSFLTTADTNSFLTTNKVGSTAFKNGIGVNDLTNSVALTPADGDVLAWNAAMKKWTNVVNTGSTGEVNTGLNLGGGYPTFDSKAGLSLQFNTLTNGSDFTVSSNNHTFTWELSTTIPASGTFELYSVNTKGRVTAANYPVSIQTWTNILYVSTAGNNATAVKNNRNFPAATLIWASTNTVDGDLIFMLDGPHALNDTVTLRDGVSLRGIGTNSTVLLNAATFGIIPGSRSWIGNLQITNTVQGANQQWALRIEADAKTNVVVFDLLTFGDSDTFASVSVDPSYVWIYNSFLQSRQDGIILQATNTELHLINSYVTTIGASVQNPSFNGTTLSMGSGTKAFVQDSYIYGASNVVSANFGTTLTITNSPLIGSPTAIVLATNPPVTLVVVESRNILQQRLPFVLTQGDGR